MSTGALIALMAVIAVAITLALRGITGMDPGFVLRLLAAAALAGAAAGGWIAGRRPQLAGLVTGAAGTAGFLLMVTRTAVASRNVGQPAAAAELSEPLIWLGPLLLVATIALGWATARLRVFLS
jgi:hypothetical protein